MFDLLCNLFHNPLNVSKDSIKLSFQTDGRTEILNFCIFGATNKENLQNKKHIFSIFKKYDGRNFVYIENCQFESGQRIYWQICFETPSGKVFSEVAYFEIAVDFNRAKWIENPYFDESIQQFNKTFHIEKPFISARLYICGAGFFQSKINGILTDNHYFKPNFTNFIQRYNPHIYQTNEHYISSYTYDIEGLLTHGENQLSIELGGGYFHNEDQNIGGNSYSFDTPKLMFEIHIVYADKTEIFFSDENTLCRNTSHFCTLYFGDRVDFLKPLPPYNMSQTTSMTETRILPSKTKDDIIVKKLNGKIISKEKHYLLYEFEMNHTGFLTLTVKGKKGAKLKILFAECLTANGKPNMETASSWAVEMSTKKSYSYYQTAEYILSGNNDFIEANFCWNCYRYAEFISDSEFEIIDIHSNFLHSDLVQNSKFSCSESILNDLWAKFIHTLYCNMHSGIISDCPHREKLPYTGDGQITMQASMYSIDCEIFYAKILLDIISEQSKDGFVPYTAPSFFVGGGYAWGNALVILPKFLYEFSGDIQYIEKSYFAILQWIDFYEKHIDSNGIVCGNGNKDIWLLGDWLAPEPMQISPSFISTCCFFQAVEIALQFSKILGKPTQRLSVLKDKIADTINQNFFDESTGNYCNGKQGENIMPLFLGITKKENIERIKENIEKNYEKNGYHFDTGIILTPMLIDCLCDFGMSDIALKLMLQTTYPSFYFMLKDESTLCEHWSKKWIDLFDADGKLILKGGGDSSHCHHMFGGVVAWLYKRVAGLDLSQLNQGKLLICPAFLDKISSAAAEKQTRFGKTAVSYTSNENFSMQISVPYGLTAEIKLCNLNKKELFVYGNRPQKILCTEKGFNFTLPFGDWEIRSCSHKPNF